LEYIIFDLEWTCEKGKDQNYIPEIIEIGAVKMDMNTCIIDTFFAFIKPTTKPTLSNFCKSLTKISQEEIDGASDFNTVIRRFESWIGYNECKIMSWGQQDKIQIINETIFKGYTGIIELILDEYYTDLQMEFMNFNNIFSRYPWGLKRTLCAMGIPFVGKSHNALNDALNCIPGLESILLGDKVNTGCFRIELNDELKEKLLAIAC
jgi:inhibitor of KinA sporulation pathway (predicted exonuclease)